MTAINLGRGSPARLGATYPPTQRTASMLAYLVLLRVEIARFTHLGACTGGLRLRCGLQVTRLCCSDPHLTVERCYLLRCPSQSGRSSSAPFRDLHQRRSGELHGWIIGVRLASTLSARAVRDNAGVA